MVTKKGIKGWPTGERPRERLISDGAAALTDAELLAIILRTGEERVSAVDLARSLLRRAGGVREVGSLSVSEMCSVRGIGPAKAAQILAALEIGKRVLSLPFSREVRVHMSEDIYRHYRPFLIGLKKEVFKVILLDGKNRILRDVTVSEGSLTLNIVHPREVFNSAVRESAASIILLHNHPSGDPSPSPEDGELTTRLVRAGEIMGIPVLDHIIVGAEKYFSFADRGLL